MQAARELDLYKPTSWILREELHLLDWTHLALYLTSKLNLKLFKEDVHSVSVLIHFLLSVDTF